MTLRNDRGWINYPTGTLEREIDYLQLLRDNELLDGVAPRHVGRSRPRHYYIPFRHGMHAQRDAAAEDLIQAAMASDPDVCCEAWQLIAICRPSYGVLRHALEIVGAEQRIRGMIAGATLDAGRKRAARALLRGKTPRGFDVPKAIRATLLRPLIDAPASKCETCGCDAVAGLTGHYPGCETLAAV